MTNFFAGMAVGIALTWVGIAVIAVVAWYFEIRDT